uniref:(California timema) hypothetical protein n=1 Tax=Timema californicum TaxID=61474 RepID=A0A7R9J7C5_TIMCA|nr:unnamed protein product [Timema californicum]
MFVLLCYLVYFGSLDPRRSFSNMDNCNSVQPAGDHINSSYECVLFPPAPPTAGKTLVPAPQCYKTVQPTLCYKTHTKDDGSSGYGSPDSETFDTQCNQQV